jgi:hypothetical protein
VDPWWTDPRARHAEWACFRAQRAERHGAGPEAARLYGEAARAWASAALDVPEDYPNARRDLTDAATQCQQRTRAIRVGQKEDAVGTTYRVEVRFTGRRPTEEDLAKLAGIFDFDGDMPKLTADGLSGTWRKLPIDIERVAGLFAFCGFPARGRATEDRGHETPDLGDAPWAEGRPTLEGVPDWIAEAVAVPMLRAGFAVLTMVSRD